MRTTARITSSQTPSSFFQTQRPTPFFPLSEEKKTPRDPLPEGVSVFPYPIFDGFESWNRVLPSVQEPIALVSVDFASPKMMDPKKRYFILETVFALKSVDFVS